MANRLFTVSEEIANSGLHGLGLLLSLVGTVWLVILATRRGDAKHVTAVSIFGVTLILVYSASTLYHGLPISSVKQVFERVDNATIYLLIAGTYTPFALGLLRGGWGWSLLGIEWGLAILGVAMTISIWPPIGWLSLLLYLTMGWLILIALRPLRTHLAPKGLMLLVAGGVAYTIGVIFYVHGDLPYYHAVWHTFVLTGSICHFFAVLLYAIPRPSDSGDCLSSIAPTELTRNGFYSLSG